jgi:hypothetical protein
LKRKIPINNLRSTHNTDFESVFHIEWQALITRLESRSTTFEWPKVLGPNESLSEDEMAEKPKTGSIDLELIAL